MSGDGSYSTTDASGSNPGGFNPGTVGTWQWVAVYTPDGNNNPTTSACGDEPVHIGPASPGISTTTNPSSEVVGSGNVNDTATLTGGFNPGGTITFFLYNPANACAGPASYTDTVPVSGDGSYSTTDASGSNPGGFNPGTVGTWQWVAVYTPDAGNNPAHTSCGDEPVHVTKQSPHVTTQTAPSSELVGSGALQDSATLTGGFNPTGTITFFLFSPGQVCSATPSVFAFTTTVTVNGNKTYGPVTGPIPNIVGTWQWLAVYSGDGNNNGANSGCGSEPVVVTAPPSVGFTMGFWHNMNGHAVLDPDHNGDIDFNGADVSWTIGINQTGLRFATVSTLAQSDKILPATNACGTPSSFNLDCSKLPGGLQVGTLNNLAGQTLALTYNQNYVPGFSSQTLGFLACTAPASLKVAPYSLGPSSTMAQVLAAANYLIAHAVKGGSTTQQTASDMAGLLGDCVNTKGM